jgi:hypothetical protein
MRSVAYQKVMQLHDEDELPFVQHNMYRDSSRPTSFYKLDHLQDMTYVTDPPEERHGR